MGKRALWMDAAGIPVKVKKRKPVNKVSKRQLQRLKQYYSIVDELFKKYPICQRCFVHPTTEFHHKKGRSKENLFNHLIGLCSQCHRLIHDHPAYAMKAGFMLPRNTK